MTPAGRILRDEILRNGPISFRRFMEVALYDPSYGYYRRTRDPFGRDGDFYTAEQIQPVFGILIARLVAEYRDRMGSPEDFAVVELGAGRGEMAPAFTGFRYHAIDIDRGELPDRIHGVVFANEFFDALTVEVFVKRAGIFRERLVTLTVDGFAWIDGLEARGAAAAYLERYATDPTDGTVVEISPAAFEWIERISRRIGGGFLIVIDYGYQTREAVRFPQGTLMSYRRHQASEEVLASPGDRDITAHVPFSALIDFAVERAGFRVERFERMASTLLETGRQDQFAAIFTGVTPEEEVRRRLQLKTLLFGMGETFQTLVLEKVQ
jgi:SAM-dependent MidA family methyltransferase